MTSALDGMSIGSADDGSATDDNADTGLDGLDASTFMLPALTQALAGAGRDAPALAQTMVAALRGAEGGNELLQQLQPLLNGVAATSGAQPIVSTSADSTLTGNVQTVAASARRHGVDPALAVAMMLVESGGNARAVGDGGTSFGLFQLHRGGMLTAAGLTTHEAFDPATNADVAMRSLAAYAAGRPNAAPGQLAAASQRPADPDGYAARVEAQLPRARALLGIRQ